jgi:hypothetical protein
MKPQKAHLALYAQVSVQIQIDKAADALNIRRPIVRGEVRKKSSCNHMGAAPAGSNYLALKRSAD